MSSLDFSSLSSQKRKLKPGEKIGHAATFFRSSFVCRSTILDRMEAILNYSERQTQTGDSVRLFCTK